MKRYRDRDGDLASAVFFDGTNADIVMRMLSTRFHGLCVRPDGSIYAGGYFIYPHRWVILFDNGFFDVKNEISFTVHFEEVQR